MKISGNVQTSSEAWRQIPGSEGYALTAGKGLILKAQSSGLNGLYLLNDEWTNYKVHVEAERISGEDGFSEVARVEAPYLTASTMPTSPRRRTEHEAPHLDAPHRHACLGCPEQISRPRR